ncbi:MAG: type I-MYXAN CRISPR-associated protein Cas6/Cmx6 [Gammaproteobacteria bacterium]|jgi:CRISPR-associated protein Cas6|nr:type I-MYXAN CRISPR-associated protein Cas6/Cmx6 [Gammaproteobacteria bacterium]
MYWQEDSDKKAYIVPDDIVDLAFRISCRCLPLDHAYALSQVVLRALPWIEEKEDAGIHLIHGAESGHGWQRPEDPDDEVLHLSRRAKLTLRLPKECIDAAKEISGVTLEIDGYPMEVGQATVRPLSPLTTLFSRYVVASEEEDEEQFVRRAADKLMQMGISVTKLLCGKAHVFRLPNEHIFSRRLMVADLKVEDSVKLQQRGLGPCRKLGCGLFIPHKGIGPVNAEKE